jgi:hypothetical protein
MKTEHVAAVRINMTLRHKKTGRVYPTILNSEGFSWSKCGTASWCQRQAVS